MTQEPLISIIVVTYNSSKFIVETLESAKNQTYQNIELIISDDGSKDETIIICRNWLEINKARFIKAEIITVNHNCGLPSNCNRGVRKSTGKWLKIIAGDDILMDDCIKLNIDFASGNNKKFVISDVLFFSDSKGILRGYGSPKEIRNFFSKLGPAAKLKSYIRNSVFLNSPTYFYAKEVYEINNGFDEEFKVLEDNPFIINTLKNNIDIFFLNAITVKYRINPSSLTGQGGKNIEQDLNLFYTKYKKEFFDSSLSMIDAIFHFLIKFEIYMKGKGLSRSIFHKVFKKASYYIRKIA